MIAIAEYHASKGAIDVSVDIAVTYLKTGTIIAATIFLSGVQLFFFNQTQWFLWFRAHRLRKWAAHDCREIAMFTTLLC